MEFGWAARRREIEIEIEIEIEGRGMDNAGRDVGKEIPLPTCKPLFIFLYFFFIACYFNFYTDFFLSPQIDFPDPESFILMKFCLISLKFFSFLLLYLE